MGLADESSPLGDNYFEDKERFAVIYDTTPDLGSHCLSVLYDQLNHHASFPLTIENSESIEPVAEHWDMWFPLERFLPNGSICSEWENSRPIHGVRETCPMKKRIRDTKLDYGVGTHTARLRLIVRLLRWTATRTRSNHACSFLCQYPGMHHFFYRCRARCGAALVPNVCFIRSFLTRARTPRFKLIAPRPGGSARHGSLHSASDVSCPRPGQGCAVIPALCICG
jgi:hypothetical protein